MGYKMTFDFERPFSRHEYGFMDDFNSFTDAQLWTVAVAGTGTVAHEGSVGRSTMKLFNTAVNDAAVLATTHEIFKLISGKAMYCATRLIFTDVDTDDGMVFFGWADALAATTLADTTGAVTATDCIAIYKLPDTSVWRFHTEINGTVTGQNGVGSADSVSDTTAGGTSFQELSIEVTPRGSVMECRPFVDGVQLKTSDGVKIKHDLTIGTATDMDFGVMTKSIDAADFNLYVDYAGAKQVRS